MAHSAAINADATGFVIRGYDPVAYFAEERAVPGRSDLSVNHEGGTYLFANEANRESVKADPEKYLPQYGGYCAYGVAIGKKFDIDPASWRIVDGKLYFNLNPVILEKWNADARGNVRKSEENWPRIREMAASEL
jgi:YHS domain-containing protein